MGKANNYNYGVVLDAGSSGTRVYVYRWLKNALARAQIEGTSRLPELETKDKWTKKVHPGVSTFGETPELVGNDHLKGLVDHALRFIPKDSVLNTPIFLLATAGMRLLPDDQRNSVLASICSYLKTETDFFLPDCDVHIQVIPGETEGLYGWIAANYLLGGFDDPQEHDHGKGHHTYGFLDMGGASAQIAFAPNSTEAEKHANDLTLMRLRTIDGRPQEYKVFVTTWLGFGVNEARKKYVLELQKEYAVDDLIEIPDPCLPHGVKLTFDGKLIGEDIASQQHLLGTGAFDECLRRTLPLLEKDKPCLDEPCLINGQHVPAIDFDINHFVGISEYWHTTHEIFEMAHKDKSYDFTTYQQRVSEFCSQDWDIIEAGIDDKIWGKQTDEQTAYEVCFKASWLINILHDGIGIPRFGLEHIPSSTNGTKDLIDAGKAKGFLDPFQAVNKIKSTEISWTMGKMVLYASADVPPIHEQDLPVGFGSNVAGIPSDFQLPGGGLLQPGSLTIPDQSITGKITDTIFQSDAPHRIPGFIFFLFILVIALFYMRRRKTGAASAVFSNRRTNSSSILARINRLFGRRTKSVDYDRELEDGNQPLYDPNDFELGGMDSDEEEGKLGSGYVSPNAQRSGSKKAGISGRLTPDIMDRNGLLVRTESRERFDIGGRKSRNGSLSPKRVPR
ncbi:Golgi apyrase [Neophaeococcomyces mojaviensis]|uniref:Golgi apyrase n=1 Tax=Neophaeococcomyces mojaviensis TaxID=3383035 RepID=A0ACC3A2J1_9EURO|nr:Golgi apyrase [Knufia sp. JES_112]